MIDLLIQFFKKRFGNFLWMIVCCSFFMTVCCQAIDIAQFIDELPPNDRKELDVFFRHLIACSDFGYTLFGTKPASMDAWSSRPSLGYLFFPAVNQEVILKKGWFLWMKYSHLLQGKTFSLVAKTHAPERSTAIYLINRGQAIKIIKNHLDDFKLYLGAHITEDDVLKTLENAQSIMDETLLDNEALLGILLGYGVVNAQKFQELTDLYEIKNRTPVFPKQLYTAETNAPWERMIQRLEWNSELHVKHPVHVEVEPELVSNKLKSIKWEECGREQDDPLAQISLPSFRRIAGDREGGQWLQTYRMTRPKITAVLNSPDFLKIVLTEISK